MKVLLTGATGFVGRSLLREFRKSGTSVTAVGRSECPPHLEGITRYVQADVTQEFDADLDFEVFIHAATPASASLNHVSPKQMFDVNVQSMQNMLKFAAKQRTPPIFLFTSSGAVYGEMPNDIRAFSEDCNLAVNSFAVKSAYAEGKRAAEFLLAEATSRGLCQARLARLFAFSGPLLPLDRHFAIGNFVRDAMNNQVIVIRGDGTPLRSYLDETDMATWLIEMIHRGQSDSIYHIGSEHEITISDLAQLVSSHYTRMTNIPCSIQVMGQSSGLDGISRYVPDTLATRSALKTHETVTLEESIDKMFRAHLQ